MIPFGDWRPGQYGLDSGLAGEAIGVLPGARSYRPWPGLATSSLATTTVPRGGALARTEDSVAVIFAPSATKIYKFAGVGSSWTDVTRTSGGDYALNTDEYWVADQFGDYLVMVQRADFPQVIDITSGTEFALLSADANLPKAKTCRVVGDFLMLGDLASARSSVRWSSLNDITGSTAWTRGAKLSDQQDFPDGGIVQYISNLASGLILQQRAVRRFQRVGDRRAFIFDLAYEAQGTDSPYSAVSHEATTLFWGTDGFTSIGPEGLKPIGLEGVDEWFRETCNQSRLTAIIGALDPVRMRVFWLFPTTSNASSTTLDHIIAYDMALDKWTHAPVSASFMFPAATPGATLTSLTSLYSTLAGVPYPLGSPVWQGGAPGLAAYDSAKMLAFFSGTPLAATVQTNLFRPVPGRRFFVNGFRIIGDAENATGRVGVSERPQTDIAWQGSQSLNAQGMVPARGSGRLMQVEVSIPAGEEWDHLQGIDFEDDDLKDDGVR